MSDEIIMEYIVYSYHITEKCGDKAVVDKNKFSDIKSANEFIVKLYNNTYIEFYELQLITTYIKNIKNNIQKETHKNIIERKSINISQWVNDWRKTLICKN